MSQIQDDDLRERALKIVAEAVNGKVCGKFLRHPVPEGGKPDLLFKFALEECQRRLAIEAQVEMITANHLHAKSLVDRENRDLQALVEQLEAQVEALQRENERLKTELDKYAVLMSYDWLGDQPIECGLWCDLCHEHVDEGVGHKSTCLLASRATQPAPQSTENGK